MPSKWEQRAQWAALDRGCVRGGAEPGLPRGETDEQGGSGPGTPETSLRADSVSPQGSEPRVLADPSGRAETMRTGGE